MEKRDIEFIKIVAALITKARLKKGLTQVQVAAMLGVTGPQMNNIEKGVCRTKSEIIFKLSVIFECPIADLFPSLEIYKPKLELPPSRKEAGSKGTRAKSPNSTG